jgi:NAD(P)-dependent dehydrogenase (short-subunit alcohol dehydrogenase family)
MSVRLKPVEEQVIVLTGASSGIGLATARAAAARGATLVLVSRNEEALKSIAEECRGLGGRALAVAADVGRREDLERVAQAAIDAFGGFDTWINNAAVAIYGTIEQVPVEDQRRLFEVNYWGVVNGCLIAARHLKGKGGKIINTGSVLSDRSVILQGPYCASKHAVRGFTDAFRMELEEAGAPISVTLIKPAAIDTPYMEHARNYLDSEGTRNPPPAYDPAVVAKAMLFACENERRDLVVGFGGWAIGVMGALFPRLTDYAMEAAGTVTQTTENPGRPERRDNLYAPREDGAERSSLPGGSRKSSLLLEAQMHPVAAITAIASLGLAVAFFLRPRGAGASPARDYGRLRRRPAPDRAGPGPLAGAAYRPLPGEPRRGPARPVQPRT